METITIPKQEYEQMKTELDTLRRSDLYQRLFEFERNIVSGKKFTRKDVGFGMAKGIGPFMKEDKWVTQLEKRGML